MLISLSWCMGNLFEALDLDVQRWLYLPVHRNRRLSTTSSDSAYMRVGKREHPATLYTCPPPLPPLPPTRGLSSVWCVFIEERKRCLKRYVWRSTRAVPPACFRGPPTWCCCRASSTTRSSCLCWHSGCCCGCGKEGSEKFRMR